MTVSRPPVKHISIILIDVKMKRKGLSKAYLAALESHTGEVAVSVQVVTVILAA